MCTLKVIFLSISQWRYCNVDMAPFTTNSPAHEPYLIKIYNVGTSIVLCIMQLSAEGLRIITALTE